MTPTRMDRTRTAKTTIGTLRLLGACCLLAVFAGACSGSDGDKSSAAETDSTAAEAAASSEAGFGPCDEVKIEEFQQLFGEQFTVVKTGGVAADCTIVARDTYIGESLTIRDTDKAGYGDDFDTARSTAEKDEFCPGTIHDVEGIGDRAFYIATCDPKERPNESLHVEVDGSHIAYSAFFIPADRITSTEENLTALARRLLKR